MDWQQKFAAINALSESSLKMRAPGDWYVSTSVEIKHGGMLEGRYGNGITPEDAVQDHWLKMTELGPGERIVLHAGSAERRREVRWNGYMWEDYPHA